jgi:hypothetical protein
MKTTSAALLLLGVMAGSTTMAFVPTAGPAQHRRSHLTTRMQAEVSSSKSQVSLEPMALAGI